ncbi:arylamine N-acetyltransferase [Paenibacillus baekrokdamisoli]|uniref:Arylamine N-acetyltransferase n=1 Tax=Paenibacillus baekrokdamisoli TaxID=1712516 RepID=A0A3G9J4Z3_9BACL|nr:arylamine N-acetyltransferase [Paenibacillus baekrokdamisoli]MBB3068601.1 arylamine N-acetyltransferase [Paenibacillus baekrokdamisoli]BBH23435.1 arylamine N-acetyltransferase [Paenibacillus baekrokdamisoli]
MYMMTREEIQAYLRRIGIAEIQAPTKPYLFELHKAHVNNLSWQTVDIFAGKPAGIDFRESVQLILNHRSGYCFHLNGAFYVLLRSLGYKVSLHRAGVQPLGAEPRINSFHLGLTVNLVNEQQEEEIWIIDVGLGDMPYEPLPLHPGIYEQAPLSYKVMESNVVRNGWRLEHDPLASFVGVDFDPAVVTDLEEFKPKHEYYSRSTDSPWFNVFLIRQRHATGSNELRGCMWNKIGISGLEKTEITKKSQWLEVLGDVFGEQLVNYSNQERDELWKRVQIAHEEWKNR